MPVADDPKHTPCKFASGLSARLGALLTDITQVKQAESELRLAVSVVSNTVEASRVGASVGIAAHPLDGHTPEALLARADAAMYRAKRIGKAG